jgi:hypothetical protein
VPVSELRLSHACLATYVLCMLVGVRAACVLCFASWRSVACSGCMSSLYAMCAYVKLWCCLCSCWLLVLLLHVKEKGEGGGSHGTSGEVRWWGQHVMVACKRLCSARGLGVGALRQRRWGGRWLRLSAIERGRANQGWAGDVDATTCRINIGER